MGRSEVVVFRFVRDAIPQLDNNMLSGCSKATLVCPVQTVRTVLNTIRTQGFCQSWKTWKPWRMVQHHGKPEKLMEFNFS